MTYKNSWSRNPKELEVCGARSQTCSFSPRGDIALTYQVSRLPIFPKIEIAQLTKAMPTKSHNLVNPT
jgi:hypothetical protein